MNYKDADTCEGNSCPAWEPLTYWASEESVVRVNFIIVQTAGKKVVLVLGRLEAAGGHTEGDLFGDHQREQ